MVEKQIIVACGVIRKGRQYLLVQRHPKSKSQASLWEFSGGKIDFKEAPEQTLHRELKEELDISVIIEKLLGVASVVLEENGEVRHVILIGYLCRYLRGKVKTNGEIWQWVGKKELSSLPLTAGTKVLSQILLGK